MADNKIVHRISLEGAEKVNKQLDLAGEIGEKSSKRIKAAFDGLSLGKGGESFGGFAGKTEESRLAAERLREALHTLHPILDQAGLGLGNLGAFARVAGAGFGALAAAIVGSVVVGLAKMGDEAIIAKKRLGDILQNPAAGKSLFEGLQKQARDLQTDVGNLIPSMESLLALRGKLNNRPNERYAPGSGPSDTGAFGIEKLQAAQKAVFEGLKSGGATTDGATKAMNEFFDSLAKTGQLSSEMIENLAKAAPGFANTLAQSLQAGLGNSTQLLGELEKGTKFTAEQIIGHLGRIGPAIHQALANAPADAKTFGDALDHAASSAKNLLEVFKGPNVSIPLLEKLSETLKQDTKDLEALISLWEKLKRLVGLGENKEQPANAFGGLGSKFKPVVEFLKKAVADPGALQERDRSQRGDLNSGAFENSKPANQRVGEGFDQLSAERTDGKPAGDADVSPLAPASGFGAAPTNEAQRRQQIIESAVISKREGELQKIFNKNISDQNGGNHPSLDTQNYALHTLGHYDPLTQQFVPSKKQPARDPNAVPGAPQPTTFPNYQRGLIKEFKDRYGPSGNPPGVENPTIPKGLFTPGINPEGNEDIAPGQGSGEGPLIRVPIYKDDKEERSDNGALYRDIATLAKTLMPAVEKIRRSEVDAAGGGHIRGPGSATSDSIPAMLSDGEYVVKAEAVRRLGVDKLDALNAGVAHFADGGYSGEEIDPQTGIPRKFGRGRRKYHSPFIITDEDRRATDEAAEAYDKWAANSPDADYSVTDGAGRPVGPGYAEGGAVGDARARLASIIGNNGVVEFDPPHLATGGMPDWSAPTLSGSELNDSASGTGPLHPVTLNLPGGESIDGFHAQPDAVAQLRTAANKAKRFSTGTKPSWYGK